MEIEDEHLLSAPRQTVWELLNDADVLRACIPGCESLDKTDGDSMAATVSIKIGPIRARFAGAVRLVELNPPESYSIVGEGKGGMAGFAKGRADVRLEEVPEGTLLRYKVTTQIGGKIAQLGSRLILSTSKKLSGEFFECLAQRAASLGTAADPRPHSKI